MTAELMQNSKNRGVKQFLQRKNSEILMLHYDFCEFIPLHNDVMSATL